jgi:hypothetical protein
MNPSFFRIVGSVLVCAWVLSLPATAWAQTEDEPFRRGISARGDKKWAEMADEMRKAIAINAMESTRKVQVRARIIFGGNSTEYLPHYYLGEALKNQQNCAGAITEWEISEDQKVVKGIQQVYADLNAGYKECAARGVLLRDEFRQQIVTSDQVYNDALTVAKRLEGVRANSPDLWKSSDAEADYERARNDLGVAQKGLVKARQTRMLADFSESRTISVRATNALRPLETKLGNAVSARNLIGQQATETQQVLAAIETTERSIDAVKVALSPELAASRESARATVRTARERLGVAEKTQSAIAAGEALRLAQEASDAFGKVLDQVSKLARGEFEQRFQQTVAAATEQFSFVVASFATLERLIAEKPGSMTPDMSTQRESLGKSRIQLQRRLDNSRKTESIAGVEEAMRLATEIRTKIDELIRAFGPASLRDRGVHPALEQASRLYFSGEYQQVLSALDPLGSAVDVLLQVHVHLFKAASLYALYVRSGETNQKMRTDALAEIQRCKEIDPGFRPSSKAFSPRFISFFESGGVSVASSATAPAK